MKKSQKGKIRGRKEGKKETEKGVVLFRIHPFLPSFLRLCVSHTRTHSHTLAHTHTFIHTAHPFSFSFASFGSRSSAYLWSERTKCRPSKWRVRGTLKVRGSSQETECTWAIFVLHVRKQQTRSGRETNEPLRHSPCLSWLAWYDAFCPTL